MAWEDLYLSKKSGNFQGYIYPWRARRNGEPAFFMTDQAGWRIMHRIDLQGGDGVAEAPERGVFPTNKGLLGHIKTPSSPQVGEIHG